MKRDLMGLSEEEYARAIAILGREPNLVELGCFAAMWSEHCSYKSSRVHLKNLPTTGPRVLVGPGENAGVVDVGEGWAVAFKVESHNHPSYIEPYQGAATGVGGILRDVFTMGARPIAAMNLLRFGRVEHEKTAHLVDGVVRGIGGYGNCFGVPTVYSNSDFDAAYDGNILVNAFALGVLRTDKIFLGTASGVGNPVMYVGAKTGRDGIHGATMASDSFSEGEEVERPTVQVGDPFKEKLLMEACQECFGTDCLVGIQDMGAAGLTSSTFEMASRAGSGIRIDLDKVPARETKMSAYELMLSESQERMLLVAKRGREDEVKAIFAKWDLDCVEIGTVTDTGRVQLIKDGVVAGDLPARELADEAPRYERPYTHFAPVALDPAVEAKLRAQSIVDVARAVLASPTIAPKSWIYRRYDREVGAGTLLDGTHASAALVRIPGTQRAVAMSLVCNARACSADARGGAARAVVEGVVRAASVGAVPIGVTDCLNYGNPQKPEVMGQIVDGIAGIRDACTALDVPVVSGNVSLYNQTDDRAIHPTPTIGVVGLVEDFARVVPRAPVVDGDVLVRLGKGPASLAGSLVVANPSTLGGAVASVSETASRTALESRSVGAGSLAAVDFVEVKRVSQLVREAVSSRLVSDARPVVEGGLLAALFEIVHVHRRGVFADVPAGEDAFTCLFGEDASAAFLCAVPVDKLAELNERAEDAEVELLTIGAVGGRSLTVAHDEKVLFELNAADLVEASEAIVPKIRAGHPT